MNITALLRLRATTKKQNIPSGLGMDSIGRTHKRAKELVDGSK